MCCKYLLPFRFQTQHLQTTYSVVYCQVSIVIVMVCVVCSYGHVEDIDLTRSWMLPVFRDHIQDTEIAFFAEYFLPLASQLKVKCKILILCAHC